MQLGLVGLGRMGGNMRERLRAAGHEVVGYDRNPDLQRRREPRRAGREARVAPRGLGHGARPASPTRPSTSSPSVLGEGDIIIDGGNSRFTDDAPAGRAARRAGHRLRRRRRLRRRLGPAERLRADGRRRRRSTSTGSCRSSRRSSRTGEFGFVHAGPVGAGHYAKMVHNGIEYGLMHAYAEGYELLTASELVTNVPGRRSSPGARAPSSSPGCSTCSTGRSTRTRSWPS